MYSNFFNNILKERKKQKKLFLILITIILVLALFSQIIWENSALELNCFTITSEKLPKSFDGFKIVHISDLHNAEIGENNKDLLDVIREAQPDIIAITGDLVDSRRTNIGVAIDFAEAAMKIAPCYYVTGNHEERISQFVELKQGLEAVGVVFLDDCTTKINKDNEFITVVGINDPNFKANYFSDEAEEIIGTQLKRLIPESNTNFYLLLSHRPEYFELYADYNINLILSGHAHGGQFVFPFVGGLFAPNQGLFPEYTSGVYTKNSANMIVSRGIGNSIVPFRINNRPEVILIELKSS